MGLKRWFSCATPSVRQLHCPTDDTPLPAAASGDLQRARELGRQLSNAEQVRVVPRDASFLVNVGCDRQPSNGAAHQQHQQQQHQQYPSSPPSFRRLSSLPQRAGSAPAPAGQQQQQQQQQQFWVPTFTPSPATAGLGQQRIIAQQPAGTAMVGGKPIPLAWTESRRRLESDLAAELIQQQQQQGPDQLSENSRLQQRLARLKLVMMDAAADGNCQFRAVSQQLYGSQQFHDFVRQRAVDHIKRHPEEYSAFLGEDLSNYTSGMARDGCWGDELTLRAICDSFGLVVHVVTSEQHNWYLKYNPLHLRSGLEVFLTYIAPLHYNSLRRQKTLGRPLSAVRLPSMTRRTLSM